MNRVRILAILIIAILQCGVTTSQSVGEITLEELLATTPLSYYEHLTLLTDRDCYSQGDTMFLRGDLFSAIANKQMLNSRFIYVDLVDANGSVLHREKIALDTVNRAFCGYFPINGKLENGSYTLKAYTYFMQNQGEEYFFTKSINIDSIYICNSKLFSDGELFELEYCHKNSNIDVNIKISDYIRRIDSANVAVTVFTSEDFASQELEYIDYMPFNASDLIRLAEADTTPDYYVELSQVLSGFVINRRGDTVRNSEIGFTGSDYKIYYGFTDSTGHIDCPVEWRDGITFYSYKASFYDVRVIQDKIKFLFSVEKLTPYKDVYNDLQSAIVEKKREKYRKQLVENGAQPSGIEYRFRGGYTRYWNPITHITKDSPLIFTFPASEDYDSYTVVVSGVNEQGSPVSGVWTVEN